MNGSAAVLLVFKASLLLGGALILAQASRHASARGRHRVWSATFVALVALPLLMLVLPALRVPVPAWRPRVAAAPAPHEATKPIVAARHDPVVPSISESSRHAAPIVALPLIRDNSRFVMPAIDVTALIVWLVGTAAALGALVVSLVRVRRLEDMGTELYDAAWLSARDNVARRFGLSQRVRLVASSAVTAPMAGGITAPIVFVPANAASWSDERRDIVLAHEIAHIASRDPLRHIVSRFAFTLYWFHPLVWVASRRAVAACEQACDEAVLALGVLPSTYARVLLDFADAAPMTALSAAVPMVQRTFLETRLMAILSSAPRGSANRRKAWPIVAAAVLTVSLAAAQPSVSVASPVTIASAPPSRGVAAYVDSGSVLAPTSLSPFVIADHRASIGTTPPLESSCQRDQAGGRSFNGTMSMSNRDGHRVISEQIGRRGNDRVIQTSFSDLRVCATAEGLTGDDNDPPSAWMKTAPRFVLETQQIDDTRRMEFVEGRATWSVNGTAAPVDRKAEVWRDALLAVLDATWEVSRLRGEESSLRGEISSIYGERSSLQGEISSLRGEVSSMHGEISSLEGEDSSLRGEISSIGGHVSSLQGDISSEQGAISSLQASYSDRGFNRDDVAARVKEHERRIDALEKEIVQYDAAGKVRAVQRRIDALGTNDGKAAIEARIRTFDLDGRVAAVNKKIAALDVDGQVAKLERQITALDVGRRASVIESRRDEAVARLRAAVRDR